MVQSGGGSQAGFDRAQKAAERATDSYEKALMRSRGVIGLGSGKVGVLLPSTAVPDQHDAPDDDLVENGKTSRTARSSVSAPRTAYSPGYGALSSKLGPDGPKIVSAALIAEKSAKRQHAHTTSAGRWRRCGRLRATLKADDEVEAKCALADTHRAGRPSGLRARDERAPVRGDGDVQHAVPRKEEQCAALEPDAASPSTQDDVDSAAYAGECSALDEHKSSALGTQTSARRPCEPGVRSVEIADTDSPALAGHSKPEAPRQNTGRRQCLYKRERVHAGRLSPRKTMLADGRSTRDCTPSSTYQWAVSPDSAALAGTPQHASRRRLDRVCSPILGRIVSVALHSGVDVSRAARLQAVDDLNVYDARRP
ncbi:hypothetical protein B0H10DRAFT_1966913 [Mycena sp. CBHHK59/15]|nr:hypothetical protein B0H10DRAFT_1966913 [Mycena sp. CBHHK59/15]